jgi:WhiB family redox-sensing transcriptional regulator
MTYGQPAAGWDKDDWRNEAECRRVDASLFFPVGSTGDAVAQIASAKTVCQRCPVQDACLQYAFETNQEAGIWGGKDEDERRRLRRAWRAGRQRRSVRV